MKRLAGRYATRESEVDQLLRGQVFVDLYRVVRQGIRASVESYSIKRLEPLYGFKREIDLRDAGESIVEFEHWLEPEPSTDRDALLEQIKAYNRDDCVSTYYLREWLEEQRAALVMEVGPEALPRPTPTPPDETEDSEEQQALQELVDRLTEDLPKDLTDGTSLEDPAQRGRWLLAQLVDWHRREHKAVWWRYFHLKDELTEDERAEETDVIGRLTFLDAWPDPNPRAGPRSIVSDLRNRTTSSRLATRFVRRTVKTPDELRALTTKPAKLTCGSVRRGLRQSPRRSSSSTTSTRGRSPTASSVSPSGSWKTELTLPGQTGRRAIC